jgi:hypothetical protein
MCAAAGSLIYFLRGNIEINLLDNVCNFLKSIHESNQRVTHGVMYLLHAIIVSQDSGFIRYIQQTYNYIREALKITYDEPCTKFACGLVVDMSLALS